MASPAHRNETQAEGGQHIFPPFDTSTFPSQLLWLVITFTLLYLLMSKAALPRLASIFEARRNRITADLNQAQKLKGETEAAIKNYETALREARESAHKIAQVMRSDLAGETDKNRAKVEAELSAKVTEAEHRIAALRDKAMGEVEKIAKETAEVIVDHLLGSINGAGVSGAALKRTA